MTINKKKAILIGLYGTVHALVDFCSAVMVFSLVGKVETIELLQAVILYNVFAFGLQSVFGALADKIGKPQNFAVTGCLVLLSSFFVVKNPFLTVSLAGIGNALFHTGGGIISLKMGNGRAKLPGLFVAPGAIGLFLGTYWSSISNGQNLFCIFALTMAVGLLSFIEPVYEQQKILAKKSDFPVYMIILICILISVCIRSFIGLSYDFTAKSDFNLLFAFVISVALGKACGGFLSDRFGMFNTAVIGLLLSIPFLKYGYIPYLAMLGMFFFNLTMPITVTALANMMPKYKGFAFGLTTLALLIGFLPVIADYKIPQSMMFFEIIIFSVIVTAVGLKLYEKLFENLSDQ